MLSKLLADSQLRGGKRSSLFGQLLPDFRSGSVTYNFLLADRTVVPLCCQFATRKQLNGRAVLAVGSESGFVAIIDTSTGGGPIDLQAPSAGPLENPRAYTWRGHPDAIFDLRWNSMDQDCTMLTASGDQVVRLWDVERRHPIGTFVGHSGSIKSISFQTHHPCKIACVAICLSSLFFLTALLSRMLYSFVRIWRQRRKLFALG
jgi:WD40 repeat protein